uniref:Uncharacterized protein n=1 Tax=Myoviridae sp. ctbWL16 TaxID=2826668 RepID=A0A8S5MSG9_9CAUD|nr:MAG TPA: hypothetical protein [Myoviridae sp. ctbWL16]
MLASTIPPRKHIVRRGGNRPPRYASPVHTALRLRHHVLRMIAPLENADCQ